MCAEVLKFASTCFTLLSQRDARLRNVVKCIGYCIKQIDFIFALSIYSDEAQRRSKRPLVAYFFVLTTF